MTLLYILIAFICGVGVGIWLTDEQPLFQKPRDIVRRDRLRKGLLNEIDFLVEKLKGINDNMYSLLLLQIRNELTSMWISEDSDER